MNSPLPPVRDYASTIKALTEQAGHYSNPRATVSEVLAYLRRQLAANEHTGAYGLTVADIASRFLCEWRYDWEGPEGQAIARLLELGAGQEMV